MEIDDKETKAQIWYTLRHNPWKSTAKSTDLVHGRPEALQSRDLDNYRGEVRAVLLPKLALFCYKFRKLRIKDKFAKPATNNPGFELVKIIH